MCQRMRAIVEGEMSATINAMEGYGVNLHNASINATGCLLNLV